MLCPGVVGMRCEGQWSRDYEMNFLRSPLPPDPTLPYPTLFHPPVVQDVTEEAKRIVNENKALAGGVNIDSVFGGSKGGARVPVASSYANRGKVVARGLVKIQYGDVSA